MNREDILSPEARHKVGELNRLIVKMYALGLYPSSWYGTLPSQQEIQRFEVDDLYAGTVNSCMLQQHFPLVGKSRRPDDYEPLPDAVDDARFPWFLYWQIYWILNKGVRLRPSHRILDAGGASSLFACLLGSRGIEVHTVDLDSKLVKNANRISHCVGWQMFSYTMNMTNLGFKNQCFDHAFSICVFEHLNYDLRQVALREIARCLRLGGTLSLTFDYGNPAVDLYDFGPDISARNQIQSPEDVYRNFLANDVFEIVGNRAFVDDGSRWLRASVGNWPISHTPFTIGALFLRKKYSIPGVVI